MNERTTSSATEAPDCPETVGGPATRVADLREGLLRFQRLMAEQGIAVKLPSMTPDLNWTPPPMVFPFDGDEMSAFVIRLRREGRL
ncbi:hypothetical protein [Longimicrobium sp.]|jgi:hypothetical protein|uniref:hypothetical protein n=1 Tax=Longimicrobium sp. TaxID=2029185 RepID=UPI002EDB1FED